jgi:predicted regulator of Ras-like GTPase activity (Roadblock/LC7/MglB family)
MRSRIIADLAAEDGVRWVCIVGEDGLPIESAPSEVVTTEAAAALSKSLMAAGDKELADPAERVTIIGSDGILIISRIDSNFDLVLAMDRSPKHGSVRSAMKDAANRLAGFMI